MKTHINDQSKLKDLVIKLKQDCITPGHKRKGVYWDLLDIYVLDQNGHTNAIERLSFGQMPTVKIRDLLYRAEQKKGSVLIEQVAYYNKRQGAIANLSISIQPNGSVTNHSSMSRTI